MWKSFSDKPGGITIATLFHTAKQFGWKSPQQQQYEAVLESIAEQPEPAQVTFDNPVVENLPENAFILPSDHIPFNVAAEHMFKQIAPTQRLFMHGIALSELKHEGGYIDCRSWGLTSFGRAWMATGDLCIAMLYTTANPF